jgi:hypothetical protein
MKFKFNNKEYNTPESWDELKLGQYLDFQEILQTIQPGEEINTPINYLKVRTMTDILVGVPEYELDELTMGELNEIQTSLVPLITKVSSFNKLPESFELDGILYVIKLRKDISDLNSGEYSSIKTLQTQYKGFEYVYRALAVLIRPGKSFKDEETGEIRYEQDPFQRRDILNLEHRARLFKEKALAKDTYPVLDFFLSLNV